jgi:hypothetical protein
MTFSIVGEQCRTLMPSSGHFDEELSFGGVSRFLGTRKAFSGITGWAAERRMRRYNAQCVTNVPVL